MAKGPVCPLLKKVCIGHDCAWYGHMEGINPQTGKPMDTWDCAVKWIPVLITEQARQTRGVQAAVESHRNEAVQATKELNEKMAAASAFMGIVDQAARQTMQISGNRPQALPHVDTE